MIPSFHSKLNSPKILISTGLSLIYIFSLFPMHSWAQTTNRWSSQQRIPGYDNDALVPYLIADENKTVHAFTSQWVGEEHQQLAVVYSQWTVNGGWTIPVDILLSPLEQARVMGVFLDQHDFFHLIFFGGDDRDADIYYSKAPAWVAGQARAWMTPVLVGRDAITPSFATLVGDRNNNLVILYSGGISGSGLYSTYSMDNGETWSGTVNLFSTYSDELWPAVLQADYGESGFVHSVWNVTNPQGLNIAGYYARFDMSTKQWSHPSSLGVGFGVEDGMGITNPGVIEFKNQVFLIYNDGIPPEGTPPAQWFRLSNDFGVTWTEPVRPFPTHIGRNGFVSFAVDGNDVLHLLFGERIPATVSGEDIHGMWHSVWLEKSWSALEAVVSGPVGSDFDPYDARAVVSQGNVLLAAWRTDPGNSIRSKWYSYLVLDAPELPTRPLVRVIPSTRVVPTPSPSIVNYTEVPTIEQTSVVITPPQNTGLSNKPATILTSPALPLIIAIVLVFSFLAILLFLKVTKH